MEILNTQGMPVWVYDSLKNNPAVEVIDSNSGTLGVSSLIEEAVVLATSYLNNPRPILVVKKNLYHAQLLYDRMHSYLSDEQCALFSVDESLRVEAIASSPEMMAAKVDTMSSLLRNPNRIIVTSPSGLLRQLPKKETFEKATLHIEVGQVIEMNDLKQALLLGGYYQTSHIDQPLSFAFRGGIVDVYSINYNQPIRIEFFDDEIDSIRFFDVSSQKTIQPISSVDIVPASDLLFSDEDVALIERKVNDELKAHQNVMLETSVQSDIELLKSGVRESSLYPYMVFLDETASILDYMDHPLVVVSDEDAIEESSKRFVNDAVAYMQEMVQENKLLPHFALYHDRHRILDKHKTIKFDPFAQHISNINEIHLPNMHTSEKISILLDGSIVLVCLNEHEYKRFENICKEGQLTYKVIQSEQDELESGLNVMINPLTQGFMESDLGLYVVSAYELFEVRHVKSRYAEKFKSAEVLNSYEDLQVGDYIVHAQHGVGQYFGIETRTIQGVKRDFLKVIYRGNAELLVPLEQFRMVRKFVSREGVVPKLNKLGTNEWQKTKERLQENVDDIAKRLVSLYANRTEGIGYAYQKDSELQKEFEDTFEYELTPDQKSAVEDVKRDMESNKPMDRLVCGDVGFGKTEIAIRAAFKAAAENKQVAVLCPTTILAEQHFHTFERRFKDYPFEIRVLDRFVTPSNVKQTLKDTRDGKVDILIGTHRILSKDVEFKDLGLLVVDEEQRFGVEHKERIKEYKNNIDVLTLSATPIPRTLQMSLVGIRSLSQLETPPLNRYNVQTYVVSKNDSLVVDAIEKEFARNGQVFYLFNHVEEIYNVARKLQGLIPDARIGVVHGQMDRESIEDVMYKFTIHELNLLVCTTIIENGIDIPNANTIIIDNAQNFGLAQIYQIKGRVGRSDRVAYAYLLVPPKKQLSEQAEKRLQAVKEFARLGSGYKIAMRDLTIRGAGDLLGPNQSGFIDTVGIDMYMEMLENAIKKEQGIEVKEEVVQRPLNIKATSYIPKSFAPDDFDKISMYQDIDALTSLDEIEAYKHTVIDQYGRLPKEVSALFEKKKLSILVHEDHVLGYNDRNGEQTITFTKEFSDRVDGVKLFESFIDLSKEIQLRYTGGSIVAEIPKMSDSLELACSVIESAKGAIKDEN